MDEYEDFDAREDEARMRLTALLGLAAIAVAGAVGVSLMKLASWLVA